MIAVVLFVGVEIKYALLCMLILDAGCGCRSGAHEQHQIDYSTSATQEYHSSCFSKIEDGSVVS
jgi:hypothetical protein